MKPPLHIGASVRTVMCLVMVVLTVHGQGAVPEHLETTRGKTDGGVIVPSDLIDDSPPLVNIEQTKPDGAWSPSDHTESSTRRNRNGRPKKLSKYDWPDNKPVKTDTLSSDLSVRNQLLDAPSVDGPDVVKDQHQPDESDYDSYQNTERQLPDSYRDTGSCTPDICDDAEDVSMTMSTSGGAVVPTGVTVILRCTVTTRHDEPSVVSWHAPGRVAHRIHLTDDPEGGREAAMRQAAVNATTERVELRQVGQHVVTVSVLTVPNVTEADGGLHVCSARLSARCCHRNGTLSIRVYVPPSYATDLTIVGAVCFVEFLIILYFKTRSERRYSATAAPPNGVYTAQHYEPLQRRDSKKGVDDV